MTTPKLPPPPRSAQRSSGFSSSAARTSSPSAVTSSAATRLSQARPCLRSSQPEPPPRVRPPTPVVDTRPPVVASPWAWRGPVDLGPGGSASHASHAALGVDVDVAHATEVEHEPVVAERPPADRVAAGPHGDLQLVLVGEGERRDHVVGRRAASHEPRAPRDHRVEQRAGIGVLGLAGLVEAAAKAEAQLAQRGLGQRSETGAVTGVASFSLWIMPAKVCPAPLQIFPCSGQLAKMAGTGQAASTLRAVLRAWRTPRRPRVRAAPASCARSPRGGARCGG